MQKVSSFPALGFGTFFFVYVEEGFAVAAIDSRQTIGTERRDDVCKITPLDEFTIFLSQGIAMSEKFNTSAIARRKFTNKGSDIDVYKLACDWATEMTKHIEELYASDRDFVRQMKPDAAGAILLGHDTMGPVRAAQAQIQESNGTVFNLVRSIPSHTYSYTSYKEIIDEVLACRTDRAKALYHSYRSTGGASDWAVRAQLCVRAVVDWAGDQEVGGEVATIVLEQGRRWRWFHRPAFYPED
jgi:hypothetical protein